MVCSVTKALSASIDNLQLGTHTITVSVTNIDGAKDHKAIVVDVIAPDVSLAINTSTPSPASIGSIIDINAVISGDDPESYDYFFEIKTSDDQQTWQRLQDYSSTASFSLSSSLFPGENTIRITARHKQDNDLILLKKSKFWVNSEHPVSGLAIEPAENFVTDEDTVLLSALASSDDQSQSYEYKFEVKNILTKEKTLLADFGSSNSSSNQYLWDTSSVFGKYRVLAYARVANTDDLPIKQSVVIWRNRKDAITDGTLTLTGSKIINSGDTIELMASVTSGGTGDTSYEFQYRLQDDKQWHVMQSWSPLNTVFWDTTGLAGNYRVRVLMKNNHSLDRPITQKIRNIIINE